MCPGPPEVQTDLPWPQLVPNMMLENLVAQGSQARGDGRSCLLPCKRPSQSIGPAASPRKNKRRKHSKHAVIDHETPPDHVQDTAQTTHPFASKSRELDFLVPDAFLTVKATTKKLDQARPRLAASPHETVRQVMKSEVVEFQRVHDEHKAKLALGVRQRQSLLCQCT